MKEAIAFPIELANSKYSLEEIGAIMVLLSMPHLDGDVAGIWADNPTLNYILQRFIELGIASTQNIDGELHLTLELPSE